MSSTEQDLELAFEYIDNNQPSLLSLHINEKKLLDSLELLFTRSLEYDQFECAKAILILNGVRHLLNSELGTRLNQAFIRAAELGNLERAQTLKTLLADHRIITEETLNQALYKASVRAHLSLVNFLISEGANINPRTKESMSILHTVTLSLINKKQMLKALTLSSEEQAYIEEQCQKLKSVLSRLLEEGANPHLKNEENINPIEFAAACGDFELFTLLNNSEMNPKDSLLWICQHGYERIAETIIEKILEQNNEEHEQENGDIFTECLFKAIEHDQSSLTALLLKHNADYNVPHGKSRLSALHLAFNKQHRECAEVLYHHLSTQKTPIPSEQFNREGSQIFREIEERAKDNSPLLLATQSDNVELVEKILDEDEFGDVNARDSSGKTALFYAISNGNIPLMSLLLDHDAQVNLFDHSGHTPLHWAIEKRQFNAIKKLIESHADLSIKDEHNASYYEIALLLNERDSAELLYCEMNARGLTPLLSTARLNEPNALRHESIRNRHLKEPDIILVIKNDSLETHQKITQIRHLIIEKNAKINSPDLKNKSAIQLAVEQLDLELLKFLLSELHKEQELIIDDFFLLCFSAEHGFNELIQKILFPSFCPQGNITVLPSAPPITVTTCTLAEDYSSISNVEARSLSKEDLISSEHVAENAHPHNPLLNAFDLAGETALEKAIYNNKAETVALLLSLGAMLPIENGQIKEAVFNHPDSAYEIYKYIRHKGQSIEAEFLGAQGNQFLRQINTGHGKYPKIENPLFLAIKEEDFSLCERLVLNGANVNDTDEQGFSPLHWAASQGSLELVQLLAQNGASLINKNPTQLLTPLHRAALVSVMPDNKDKRSQFDSVLTYLYLNMEKPINNSVIEAANHEVRKIKLFYSGHLQRAVSEQNHDGISALLTQGVFIDEEDELSNTPFLTACQLDNNGSHRALILFLLQKGANVNALDQQGKNALMHLLDNENYELASLLISPPNSINLNAQDADGKNALMRALSTANLNAIRFLLSHISSIEQLDENNKSALFYALETGNDEIIALIFDWAKEKVDLISSNTENVFYRKDKSGFNVFHLAVQKNNRLIVNRLLCDFHMRVNVQTKDHKTALHLSVLYGNFELTKHLVEQGASLSIRDVYFRTPVELAIEENQAKIIQFFALFSINNRDNYYSFQYQENYQRFTSIKKEVSEFRDLCLLSYFNGSSKLGELAHHGLTIDPKIAELIFFQVHNNLDSAQLAGSPHYSQLQQIINDRRKKEDALLLELRGLEHQIEQHHRRSQDSREEAPQRTFSLESNQMFFSLPRVSEEDQEQKARFREKLLEHCSLDLSKNENKRIWRAKTSSHFYEIPHTREKIKVAQTVKEVLSTLDRYQNKYSFSEMMRQLKRIIADSNARNSVGRGEQVRKLISAIEHPESLIEIKVRAQTY